MAPSAHKMSTGRYRASTMREATIPMTPWCQSSPYSTSPTLSGQFSACSCAAVKMRSSSARRAVFISSSLPARGAASSCSEASSSSCARRGLPNRPAALIRGARLNTTCPAPRTAAGAYPLTAFSAASPGRRASAIFSRPFLTRMRFCPVRGTMSARVPRATRSSV